MALDSQHGDINLLIEEISNLTGGLVELKPASTAEEIILTIFKYLKQFVTDKNAVYETNCRLLNQILGSKQDAKRLRIVFEAISMLETDVGDNLCYNFPQYPNIHYKSAVAPLITLNRSRGMAVRAVAL